jgi:hypothetical protein
MEGVVAHLVPRARDLAQSRMVFGEGRILTDDEKGDFQVVLVQPFQHAWDKKV